MKLRCELVIAIAFVVLCFLLVSPEEGDSAVEEPKGTEVVKFVLASEMPQELIGVWAEDLKARYGEFATIFMMVEGDENAYIVSAPEPDEAVDETPAN